MHATTHGLLPAGMFLGLVAANYWTVIGWLANLTFSSRFLVQWYATEKKKQVTVPVLFWWLSLVGSLLFLAYAIFYDRHHVFIFAYAFPWIPYVRNLIIYYRYKNAEKTCPGCGEKGGPRANYCQNCGTKLPANGA